MTSGMHGVACEGASGLVADLGGTNARFALVDHEGRIEAIKTYRAAESASLEDVIRRYLDEVGCAQPPAVAILAIAGAVVKDHTRFSNLDWSVDAVALRRTFGFKSVELINDFTAQALAVPRLAAHDLRNLGPVGPMTRAGPIAVIGAGTGFGAATLVRGPIGDIVVPSEAGHASFAPTDEFDLVLWEQLKRRYGRVSVERLLSGSGLLAIYEAVCKQSGRTPLARQPADIVAADAAGDLEAARSVERFARIYGAVAGDLALTFGASGGVYLAGGLAPRLVDRLASAGFREAFEDKGRLSNFVRAIPTLVVMNPTSGLLGAAVRLSQVRPAEARHARSSDAGESSHLRQTVAEP